MLADAAKAIVEVLKLAPRYLAAVCLISGLMLFPPDEWISRIGLEGFAKDHRKWIGLTFLISSCVCLVSFVIWLGQLLRDGQRARSNRAYVVKKLNSLTEDEKQILRYYYAKNTRANTLRVDDGVVQELAASRVIYRSAQVGDMVEGFAHNITDFAWEYIHANPQVLVGSTNTYRTDKRSNDW
ncbi:MAG: superinfection exclusion B family protein [Burkholderiales bacterium]|jgi:hypothetical protein|nr:superinfection exclusion B family protein [Burkholderiales bacterium]